MLDSDILKNNYTEINFRIRNAQEKRDAEKPHFINRSVHLIAVSKNQSVEKIKILYDLGQRDFGENYVQELIAKDKVLKSLGCAGIRWHFIGHLQTNKVKLLVPLIYAIHSVCSLKLASEINKHFSNRLIQIDCFIELNLDDEPTKSGFSVNEFNDFCLHINQFENIRFLGAMSIPNPLKVPKDSFKRLYELSKNFSSISMGMSSDFETAIIEGSTHIRVGTALFGSRNN